VERAGGERLALNFAASSSLVSLFDHSLFGVREQAHRKWNRTMLCLRVWDLYDGFSREFYVWLTGGKTD
jgi:hypothetical protein